VGVGRKTIEKSGRRPGRPGIGNAGGAASAGQGGWRGGPKAARPPRGQEVRRRCNLLVFLVNLTQFARPSASNAPIWSWCLRAEFRPRRDEFSLPAPPALVSQKYELMVKYNWIGPGRMRKADHRGSGVIPTAVPAGTCRGRLGRRSGGVGPKRAPRVSLFTAATLIDIGIPVLLLP
jgi:hypothetical protein